jgi:hypothetical protein
MSSIELVLRGFTFYRAWSLPRWHGLFLAQRCNYPTGFLRNAPDESRSIKTSLFSVQREFTLTKTIHPYHLPLAFYSISFSIPLDNLGNMPAHSDDTLSQVPGRSELSDPEAGNPEKHDGLPFNEQTHYVPPRTIIKVCV